MSTGQNDCCYWCFDLTRITLLPIDVLVLLDRAAILSVVSPPPALGKFSLGDENFVNGPVRRFSNRISRASPPHAIQVFEDGSGLRIGMPLMASAIFGPSLINYT